MDIERIFLALFVIVAHFNHRDMGGALNYVSEGPVHAIYCRADILRRRLDGLPHYLRQLAAAWEGRK